MGNAKTASKNNPLSRETQKDVFYEGKKVVPVLFMSESRKYMSAQYENGDMPLDNNGNPLTWASVTKS